jgi:guanylate kinase
MLSGNSGVGKTYLLQHFQYFPGLCNNIKVVSKKTTRPPREYEPQDRTIELVFNTPKDEILKMDYHYKYRDNFYGFNKSDIDEVISQGTTAVLVVRRTDCIRKLKSQYPGSCAILVKARDKHVIQAQLMAQGVSEAEMSLRLNKLFECEIQQEYAENTDIFDLTIYNYYDNRFLVEFNEIVMAGNRPVQNSQMEGDKK